MPQIVHLTDPHLRADPLARLHGWQVEQAFEAVLAHALDRYPHFDALVLGGDLVDDESHIGYRRLNRRLAALERPILAMAGNHDDPKQMARILDCARVHGCLDINGWRLYALNSHVDASDAGCLGPAQRARLDTQLRATGTADSVLFVHHPPCLLDSAWLDAMRLADGDALGALVHRHPQVRAIVCGHAHQGARRSIGAIDCWITPSTMRQFLPQSATFAEDRHAAPGYRVLELDANGHIATWVERVEHAHMPCG